MLGMVMTPDGLHDPWIRPCLASRGYYTHSPQVYVSPTDRAITIMTTHAYGRGCGVPGPARAKIPDRHSMWRRRGSFERPAIRLPVASWLTLSDVAALACDRCGVTDLDEAWRAIAKLRHARLDADLVRVVSAVAAAMVEMAEAADPDSARALRNVLVAAVDEQLRRAAAARVRWEALVEAARRGASP